MPFKLTGVPLRLGYDGRIAQGRGINILGSGSAPRFVARGVLRHRGPAAAQRQARARASHRQAASPSRPGPALPPS